MRSLTLAATTCLLFACMHATAAPIADREIEAIVSRNEATRERLSAVRYEIAQGDYVYSSPTASPNLVPLSQPIRSRTAICQRQGTVMARGDFRAYEFDNTFMGMEGLDDLATRTFAIRNDRYFALSKGIITDGGFVANGDVYIYPHESRGGSSRFGRHEESQFTADVLDFAFLSGRLGQTLRQEVTRCFEAGTRATADLEILRDLDGIVREYRIHLRDSANVVTPLVTYAIDPTAGYLIKRKETYCAGGHLASQRRILSAPLGETGLFFPSEVVEFTFVAEDGPDGILPMPRSETLTLVRGVEILSPSESTAPFGLSAFGLDSDSPVMVAEASPKGHPVQMSAKMAERHVTEKVPEEAPTRRAPARSPNATPSASPGIVPSIIGSLFGFLSNVFSFILHAHGAVIR